MPLSFARRITIKALTFASFVITLIVYLAPESYNHNNVSLIKVFPSTAAIDPSTAQKPLDGPTVILGVFGSCGRVSDTSNFVCVSSAYPAKYDLSALPSNIPDIILPPAFFTALFWLALWLWALGVVSIYVSTIYVIEKYNTKIYANIVAHLALPIGLGIWLVAWVFFLKAANDFNTCLRLEGPQAPALFAQIGSVFALIGSAYACCAAIYIISRLILN